MDCAYWLIGPGSAGLAQDCPCMLLLQAFGGAYRGGCPPTACIICLWNVNLLLQLQIYKEECVDLLVPVNKRDKDQLTIREDVAGGIKVSPVCYL